MKFFKGTKMVKISVSINNDTKLVAHGKAFITYDEYMENKKGIDNLRLVIDNLEENNENLKYEVQIEIDTLGNFIVNAKKDENVASNFDDKLYKELSLNIKNRDLTARNIKKVTKEVVTRMDFANSEITLNEDTVIRGNRIPKGAVIFFKINFENLPTEELFEIDYQLY